MTTGTPHTVISGVPYAVTALPEGAQPSLEAFTGEAAFTIDMAGSPYVVRGTGSLLDDRVRFHEKDPVMGKDVRVWHVCTTDGGGFAAEHIAAF